jgi:adenylosuccinate lyase
MIDRYTLPEMQKIWSDETRFFKYSVFHHAYLQAVLGRSVILTSLDPNIDRIKELEYITKHEMQASLLEFETRIDSEDSRAKSFVHKYLTSSDVLDTVLSHTIGEAAEVLKLKVNSCIDTLTNIVQEAGNIKTIGRTHGRHAVPMELASRFKRELSDIIQVSNMLWDDSKLPGKLSGPVGEHETSDEITESVNSYFNLDYFVAAGFASQTLSRHLHSKVIYDLALLGSLVERLVTNIRLLSFNEIDELSEPFSKGQAGSSSMPHKKNPIGCENLVGIARLLRSYVTPSLENVPLWLERDMSHSSVERVILPDAFNLAYYMFTRLEEILIGLNINRNSINKNLQAYVGNSYQDINKASLPRSEVYSQIQNKYHGT